MENSINLHINPMAFKRPFIKKSRQSNLSFLSKPNLSITKASNRLSLDKTFTCPSCHQDSTIKTPRDLRLQFNYPETIEENHKAFSARLSLGKQNLGNQKRRAFRKMQKKSVHKDKLRSILQSIDMNNSIIQELFENEEEINFYKKEITRTLNLQNDLHSQIKKEVQKDRQKRRLSFNYGNIRERVQQNDRQEMMNKIEQLRNKRKLLNTKWQLTQKQENITTDLFSLNQTFT